MRRYARCAGAEVAACRCQLGSVLAVSATPSFDRTAQRYRAEASIARRDLPAGFQSGSRACKHRETRHTAHVAARLRDASADQLRSGRAIRTVAELLGHADVATTMLYTHVLRLSGGAVRCPLGALPTTGALGSGRWRAPLRIDLRHGRTAGLRLAFLVGSRGWQRRRNRRAARCQIHKLLHEAGAALGAGYVKLLFRRRRQSGQARVLRRRRPPSGPPPRAADRTAEPATRRARAPSS